jgi:hypothetical protein
MIRFDNVTVGIDGTGLLANSIGISNNNNTEPLYSVGYKGSFGQMTNNSIGANCNINYYFELNNQFNENLLSSIKSIHQNFNYGNNVLSFAGITGSGYLTSYSFQIEPYSPIVATVNYNIYHPLTGTLLEGRTHALNIINNSGIAHANHSFFYGNHRIFNFGYDFDAQWVPIYKIGSNIPTQVQLMSVNERISFVTDSFSPVDYFGKRTDIKFSLTSIRIKDDLVNQNYLFTLDLSDFTVINTSVEGRIDNYILTRVEAVRNS